MKILYVQHLKNIIKNYLEKYNETGKYMGTIKYIRLYNKKSLNELITGAGFMEL